MYSLPCIPSIKDTSVLITKWVKAMLYSLMGPAISEILPMIDLMAMDSSILETNTIWEILKMVQWKEMDCGKMAKGRNM